MTDTPRTDVEALAEALDLANCEPTDGNHHGSGFAAAILAAMPDYTIVRKDEIEQLRAADERLRRLLDENDLTLALAIHKARFADQTESFFMEMAKAEAKRVQSALRAALANSEAKPPLDTRTDKRNHDEFGNHIP